MTMKMLINATQAEETRLAVVEGRHLQYLDLSSSKRQQKKGNIYKAKISRIEQSLNAVFISYGSDRHGFLPIKEIAPEYFMKPKDMDKTLSLKDVLKEGQELIIQIQKEERGNKGAAVTTYITLPGTYVVLMPNNDKAGGVSRSIDGPDRSAMKLALNQLRIPGDYGVIIRTAGLGRTQEELQWDLDLLVNLWHAILDSVKVEQAPKLIYKETDLLLRAVRDYLRDDIAEIIIDNKAAYHTLQENIKRYRPDYVNRLKLYEKDTPLFSRYQIEGQIELAYQREISLPSGGAIVIDHTEALTSVDVNSARATKGSDIEETALKTNIEAAKEIARQLRIRDLGGLVVIDFIDMMVAANKRKVEKTIQQGVKSDKARLQVGSISKFGLLEMSRQRIRPSLQESSHHVCPRCSGKGAIRSVESLGLSVIRHIRDTSILADTEEIQVQLPIDLASFLLNEKRNSVIEIERSAKIKIVLVPNPYLETPEYQITRVKSNDEQEIISSKSYMLVDKPDVSLKPEKKARQEEPSIKSLSEIDNAMVKKPLGLFRKLYESLFVSPAPSLSSKPKLKNVATRSQNVSGKHQKTQGPHKRRPQTSQQRTNQNRSAQQRSERGRVQQQRSRGDQQQKGKAQPVKSENQTVPQQQSVEKLDQQPVGKPTGGSKAPSTSQAKQAELALKKQKAARNKVPEMNKPAPASSVKQGAKAKIADEKSKISPSQAADKNQSRPSASEDQSQSVLVKEQHKASSTSMVDEVLKRAHQSSKGSSEQVETVGAQKVKELPVTAKKEEVVQTTKPKVRKADSTLEKIIAVETMSPGAQKAQKDNIILDVALVGVKTTSADEKILPKAAASKKSSAKAKGKAKVATDKKAVKKTGPDEKQEGREVSPKKDEEQ